MSRNKRDRGHEYNICTRLEINYTHFDNFRRDSMTLRRWFERECGDSNNYASWAVERNPDTDIPYLVTYPHNGKERKSRIPDREKGARKRIDERCKRLNLHYYIQTDCRGLALYLSKEPLTSSDYTKGFGVG